MKKILILIFTLTFLNSFGQIITKTPEIDDQTSYETDITKVEIRGNYTIVSFSYQVSESRGNNLQFQFPFPNNRQPTAGYTISFNPKSYLNGNGKRFKYIKCTGIPEMPEEKQVFAGEKYRFTVYFEKIDAGIETFNLIEGKNRPEERHQYWNFYGVHINNPLIKQAIPTIESKNNEVFVTIKGKVLDANTNKPITAKVSFRVDNNKQKTDSVLTNNLGEYSFKIQPNTYTFIASAQAYEDSQESMDLSKIIKNQQFLQNIYLNPTKITIVEKEKSIETQPKTTPITEPSITKIEENKFRLNNIFFKVGEANLTEESTVQLNDLLKNLQENTAMKIRLEGHTDNVGDPEKNKRLSIERAYNMREYLIGKGMAGNRILIKGYGDTKPIADNSTEEGRKQNRRVEFVIL